ncbi:ATP-binding protein [Pusillimonas noertemannii]|uniref:ATP-binding protein n=1 Tax=Pusillimonas noertemannii TaxID=305977 RepID=UPI000A00FB6A|nr:ATP-binding protein [Pusillimonas noertemannii]
MVGARVLWALWLCACLCLSPVQAAIVDVGDAQWSSQLTERSRLFNDLSAGMSAAQVARLPDGPGGFVGIEGLDGSGKPNPAPWWIRVHLANTSEATQRLHLILSPGSIFHSAEFYVLRDGQWVSPKRPASATGENAAGRYHSQAVTLAPGQDQIVLIRTTGVAPAQLAPYLYSDARFRAYLERSAIWDGLLFGGLLALAWSALILALFSRSRSFLLLAALSFATLLAEILRRGYGQQDMLAVMGEWAYRTPLILGQLIILLFIVFVLEIARAEKVRLPLRGLLAAWAAYYIGLMVVSAFGNVYHVYWVTGFIRPFFSLTLLAIAILFIKRNAPTRKLMLAVAAFSLARASLLALEVNGVLPEYVASLSMGTLWVNPVVALAGLFINLTLLAGWVAHVGVQRRTALEKISRLQREENERLALEVARQTKALNQALEYAGEKNRQQTQIASYVSHDLRAPLATIMGYSRLIEQTADPRQKGLLDAITRSVDYQMALIDDILGYATAELKPLALKPHAIDLPDYLDELVQHAVALSRQQNNRFIAHVPGCIPRTICTDGRRLRQVLLNLLSNAAKFTRAGTIRLDLIATRGDASWKLRFTVSDSGVGIDAHGQTQIFEEFRQLDPDSAGVGLGLHIAQSILQTMGGRLSLDSSTGNGSTFSFEIEVKPVDDEVATWSAPQLLPADRPIGGAPAPARAASASMQAAEPEHVTAMPPPHVRSELALMAKNGQLSDIESWLENTLPHYPGCRSYFQAIQDAIGRLDLDAVERLALARPASPTA